MGISLHRLYLMVRFGILLNTIGKKAIKNEQKKFNKLVEAYKKYLSDIMSFVNQWKDSDYN